MIDLPYKLAIASLILIAPTVYGDAYITSLHELDVALQRFIPLWETNKESPSYTVKGTVPASGKKCTASIRWQETTAYFAIQQHEVYDSYGSRRPVTRVIVPADLLEGTLSDTALTVSYTLNDPKVNHLHRGFTYGTSGSGGQYRHNYIVKLMRAETGLTLRLRISRLIDRKSALVEEIACGFELHS